MLRIAEWRARAPKLQIPIASRKLLSLLLALAASMPAAAAAPLNILHGTREMQRTRELNCQDAYDRARRGHEVSVNEISHNEGGAAA